MKMSDEIIKDARYPWIREWHGGDRESSLIVIPEDMLAEIIDSHLGYIHGALSYVKMCIDEKIPRGDAPAVFDYVENALKKMDGPS